MSAVADAFAPPPGPRVLVIDLERLPGQVTLDVFDPRQRSDYIHASRWDSYPSTLCFSWRWWGEKRTRFAATWRGDNLAELSWDLYSEATHVVTFNGRKADNRWARDDWLLAGLPEPVPWRDIDLYLIARSQFAFEAKSLDFLAHRLGLEGKRGHYDPVQARAAAGGDVKAQRALERYNRQDVAVTLAVFERLLPLAKFPGVNLGLWAADMAEHRCPKCGHDEFDIESQWAGTPQTLYALYRCRNCHGLARSANRKHATPMRGVV